jgi:hypothetical protein
MKMRLFLLLVACMGISHTYAEQGPPKSFLASSHYPVMKNWLEKRVTLEKKDVWPHEILKAMINHEEISYILLPKNDGAVHIPNKVTVTVHDVPVRNVLWMLQKKASCKIFLQGPLKEKLVVELD